MKKGWYVGVILAVWLAVSLPAGALPRLEDKALPPTVEARALTVAQAPDGAQWAAWEVDTGTDVEIYTSRQVGGEWQAPEPVQSRPDAWDRAPSLAVAADGRPWLAWSTAEKANPLAYPPGQAGERRIVVSRWTGERWTPPEAVPQGDVVRASQPALAAAPGGAVWLAWAGFDGTDDEIWAQRWDGKGWSAAQQVSADDEMEGAYDRRPRLAAGPDGEAWLVWTGHQAGPDDEIYASRWTGRGWSPEQMVSRDDDALDVSPSLALDAEGRPWVAWHGRVTQGNDSRLRILVSRWDAALATWSNEALASSPLASDVDEEHAALAADDRGEMRLAWVARGPEGSALAYASQQSGGWSRPQAVPLRTEYDLAALTVTADGQSSVLQLAQPTGAVPVESTDAKEGMLLEEWIGEAAASSQILVPAIANRYLAFGDSITWGQYGGFYPYPARLEDKLDSRVTPSEVINSGVPGESTHRGRDRIKAYDSYEGGVFVPGGVPEYEPQFVLYMEGTNDVSRLIEPSVVYDNIQATITLARRAGVDGVEFMVATIIPRKDDLNDETAEMNEQAVKPAAQARTAPLCDQWQAFYNYGPWRDIYRDAKHPNEIGLQLIADTFYGCVLGTYDWLHEETTPPTAWISSLAPESACGQIDVGWEGSDNLSEVVDYDVQVQVNGGAWSDWLLATPVLSDTYPGGAFNDTVAFRVRGRDVVGNQGEYSASVSTQVTMDNTPPDSAHVAALPPVQTAPFVVSWSGSDTCSGVVAYDVQTRVGENGIWQDWALPPSSTSGIFDPASPMYGETYSFRARAQDAGGNVGDWSEAVSTTLARFSVAGTVVTVRDEPVVFAQVALDPAAMAIETHRGGFTAYLIDGGSYDLTAGRSGFGILPPMHLAVTQNVEGLAAVLPAADEAVVDGGFEAGTWGEWQIGGTLPPTLTAEPHSGEGALLLGSPGETSWVRQTLSATSPMEQPTLSLLARLDDAGGAGSVLHVELTGTAISLTQEISGTWSHVWLPVEVAVGQVVTLTLTVTDGSAVRVDEVSLGSALPGGSVIYVPLILRTHVP